MMKLLDESMVTSQRCVTAAGTETRGAAPCVRAGLEVDYPLMARGKDLSGVPVEAITPNEDNERHSAGIRAAGTHYPTL